MFIMLNVYRFFFFFADMVVQIKFSSDQLPFSAFSFGFQPLDVDF